MNDVKLITIILPCFNEAKFIESAVRSLLTSEHNEDRGIELIIVDGASTDGTRDIALRLSEKFSNVIVLDNPARRVAQGFNAAVSRAKGQYIVRADCHAEYPSGYIDALIDFHLTHDAINVGGSLENVQGADTFTAKAINEAMASVFGVGPSFRTYNGKDSIIVDTVPFGCWKRDTFDKYGSMDPYFERGQDLEYNTRCRLKGGKIYCLPYLKIKYFNRTDMRSFLKMIFQIGYWKHFVNRKHGMISSIRQLAPIAFAIYVLFFPLAILLGRVPLMAYVSGICIYGILSLLASIIGAKKEKGYRRLAIAGCLFFIFPAMHFVYGLGFLDAILSDALRLKSGVMGESTR